MDELFVSFLVWISFFSLSRFELVIVFWVFCLTFHWFITLCIDLQLIPISEVKKAALKIQKKTTLSQLKYYHWYLEKRVEFRRIPLAINILKFIERSSKSTNRTCCSCITFRSWLQWIRNSGRVKCSAEPFIAHPFKLNSIFDALNSISPTMLTRFCINIETYLTNEKLRSRSIVRRRVERKLTFISEWK